MAGKKLLVADDSLTIQKVIKLALSNEGYDIQSASDGNDATEQVSVFRPAVVLIDISLPGKSAFEVKRAINEMPDLAAVRFVLMSSAFEKVDEVQASQVQFHGRLTKPFDPAHLRQVLTDVLSKVPEAPSFAPPPIPADAIALDLSPPPPPPPPPSIPLDLSSPPAPKVVGDRLTLELPEGIKIESSEGHVELEDGWFTRQIRPALDASEVKTVAPPPPSPPKFTEDDIKGLTDSTIAMSGLLDKPATSPSSSSDDFQWNIQEPSLKPLPGMLDSGGLQFDWGTPPPAPSASPAGEYDFSTPLQPEPGLVPSVQELNSAPGLTPSVGIQFSTEEIQKLVQKQVQEQVQAQLETLLKKMAEKTLPDIAERVIKSEIHRMLHE